MSSYPRVESSENLVAPSTEPALWTRHIADSLQLLALVPDARVWADLGTGAGFPGVPVACALPRRKEQPSIWSRATPKRRVLREGAQTTGAPGTCRRGGWRISSMRRRQMWMS